MTPSQTIILRYLQARRGQIVPREELIDALYSGARQPGNADLVLRVHICHMRNEVAIETITGYRLPS